MKSSQMAEFRPNSEIIENCRKFQNFYGHFLKRQIYDFWGRTRVLEPKCRFLSLNSTNEPVSP